MRSMMFKGDISGFILKPLKVYLLWFILSILLMVAVNMIVGSSGGDVVVLDDATQMAVLVQNYPMIGFLHTLFVVVSIFLVAWIVTLQFQYLIEHTWFHNRRLTFSSKPMGLTHLFFLAIFMAIVFASVLIIISKWLYAIHPSLLFFAVMMAVLAEFYLVAWVIYRFIHWVLQGTRAEGDKLPSFTFKGNITSIMQVILFFSLIYALMAGLGSALIVNFSNNLQDGAWTPKMILWVQMMMIGMVFLLVALTGPFLITQIMQYFAINTWYGNKHFTFTGRPTQLLGLFFTILIVGLVLYLSMSLIQFLFSWTTIISWITLLIANVLQVFFSVWVLLMIYNWFISFIVLSDDASPVHDVHVENEE